MSYKKKGMRDLRAGECRTSIAFVASRDTLTYLYGQQHVFRQGWKARCSHGQVHRKRPAGDLCRDVAGERGRHQLHFSQTTMDPTHPQARK